MARLQVTGTLPAFKSASSRAPRGVLALLLLACIVTAVPAIGAYAQRLGAASEFDFGAFYCGARVRIEGADPYRYGPLHQCEQSAYLSRITFFHPPVVPDPYPGYALAAFVPIALLPFESAKHLWFVLSMLAVIGSALALTRLVRCEPIVAFVSTILMAGAMSIALGQMVPFCLLALVLAAGAVRKKRYWGAAAALAFVALQPLVGLSVIAALALRKPRARLPLAVLVVGLAAVSVAALGLSENVEYVTQVVPRHALSELSFVGQFALAPVLFQAGVSAKISLALGSLSTLAMLCVGMVMGRRLATRYSDDAFLVLVPPACVLLGGTFLHLQDYAFALPLALLLRARISERVTPLADAAFIALVVPWQWLGLTFWLILPAAFGVGLLLCSLRRDSLGWFAGGFAVSLAFTLAITYSFWSTAAKSSHHHPGVFASTSVAEIAWTRYERDLASSPGDLRLADAARLLSIGALGWLLVSAARKAKEPGHAIA